MTFTTDNGIDEAAGTGYWFKLMADEQPDAYIYVNIYWPHGDVPFINCFNTSSNFDLECDDLS